MLPGIVTESGEVVGVVKGTVDLLVAVVELGSVRVPKQHHVYS